MENFDANRRQITKAAAHHRDDNVLIVVAPIRPGDREIHDGYEVMFTQSIAIGHKVAVRKKRAIVATARKLPVLLHHLWVSREIYEPLHNSRQTTVAAAA